MTARACGPLAGHLRVPGDKSISHRAVILAGLALGRSTVTGLLEGTDVMATAVAMGAFGATLERKGKGCWQIQGIGVGGLCQPDTPLDFGNSGTGARLVMGVAASHPISTAFKGDQSLSARPMNRVLAPLEMMGARVEAATPGRLPLTIHGAREPLPITYRTPVASAQVKSAVLLAGLNTPGQTTVIEAAPTRDHTERMLALFGAEVAVAPEDDGTTAITVTGHGELRATDVAVPADPSSAAFAVVAGLTIPGSDIVLSDVLVNPLRAGLFETLAEMGADITFLNERLLGGEPVADIQVRASKLKGVRVPAARAPSMIDEYPVLAVAAAHAQGETVMEGLAELKVKESDRLQAVADGLAACGVAHTVCGETLTVSGGGPVKGGGRVDARHDHRIAMAFLVLGLGAHEPVMVSGAEMIETSFPGFADAMNALGAGIEAGGDG